MKKNSLTISFWLGGLILLVYAWFAYFFAYERILSTDNSTCFISILNEKKFVFPEYRYGTFLVQVPLLIGMALKANLNTLIHLYSLSFPLLYLGIFLLIGFWANHKPAAIGLSLGLILGVAQSFFHPVTETHQAIAYSFLFYGFWFSNRVNLFWKVAIGFSGFTMALLVHPVAVWIIAFMIVWGSVFEKNVKANQLFVPAIVLVFMVILRSLFTIGSYDQEQYHRLLDSLLNINQLPEWNSTRFFFEHWKMNLSPWLVWLIGILVAVKLKKRLALGLLIIAPLGFLILAAATFLGGDSRMMMEKAFLPAWVMVALATSTLLADGIRITWLFPALILLLGSIGFYGIWYSGVFSFQNRIQALDHFIEMKRGGKQTKFIAKVESAPEPMRYNHWATAIDVLLRSTALSGKSMTLYLAKPDEEIPISKNPDAFLFAPWWRDRKTDCLNAYYFRFEPQPYDSINFTSHE